MGPHPSPPRVEGSRRLEGLVAVKRWVELSDSSGDVELTTLELRKVTRANMQQRPGKWTRWKVSIPVCSVPSRPLMRRRLNSGASASSGPSVPIELQFVELTTPNVTCGVPSPPDDVERSRVRVQYEAVSVGTRRSRLRGGMTMQGSTRSLTRPVGRSRIRPNDGFGT